MGSLFRHQFITSAVTSVFILLAAVSQSWAQTCATSHLHPSQVKQEVNFQELFPQIRESYPVLYRILDGRLLQRTERKDKSSGWGRIKDIISNCKSQACPINVTTEEFSFTGNTQITKEGKSTVMTVNIAVFSATQERKEIRLTKRPAGLNLQFLNLMGTVFSAIHTATINNPEITTVRIIGSSVVNESLARSLKELGFAAENGWSVETAFEQYVRFALKTAPTAIGGVMARNLFEADSSLYLIPAIGGVVIGKTLYRTMASGIQTRDWVLEIPVDRK